MASRFCKRLCLHPQVPRKIVTHWQRQISYAFKGQAHEPGWHSNRKLLLAFAGTAVGISSGFVYAKSISSLRLDTHSENFEQPILDNKRLPVIKYATVQEMEMALDEIRYKLSDTEGIISTDSADLRAHGYSEWSSVNVDVLPVTVAYPRSTEQVQTIARVCHKHRQRLTGGRVQD